MKKLLTLLVSLTIFQFSSAYAQSCGQLYGVTQYGGDGNLGVIFHLDPASGTQTVDYSWLLSNDGQSPYGDLTLGENGHYYGMTSAGGSYHAGIIFEWDPAANTIEKKIDLSSATGSFPGGNLVLYNHKFYGMTLVGGTNQKGTIFEWDPTTNLFSKKIDFNGTTNGANPFGSMTLFNGKFYGMTRYGGTFDKGVLFEWDPATNIITKKADFNGSGNGDSPTNGYLSELNGLLYGMTTVGGSFGGGVIFEFDPGSGTLTKKINLKSETGNSPQGSLKEFNGKFYGMTYEGGLNEGGVIFEWDPISNTYITKQNLQRFSPDGCNPAGSLTFSNGKFYGMTLDGGSSFYGVIFEWDPVTNVYTKKQDFSDPSSGCYPYGSLINANGKFYGMTANFLEAFPLGYGVIFEWDASTNVYTKKISFYSTSEGSFPEGSLTLLDGKFYGMTSEGGNNGYGTIFEWDPLTVTYTKKLDFDKFNTGATPHGSLIALNNKLYGMTTLGGSNNGGVLFEWDPVTNAFVKKVDLSAFVTGCNPTGSLTLKDGKFYGMTQDGGQNYHGVLFEWDPATNVYLVRNHFNASSSGSHPIGSLSEYNGAFYGTTSNGGATDSGVLFRWDPVSDTLITEINFSNPLTGYYPKGSLTLHENVFYGMNTQGGDHGDGILFSWNPATHEFAKQVDFSMTTKGRYPQGDLLVQNGLFYGMTSYGGEFDKGIIFSWDQTANTFTKLLDFNGVNGESPAHTTLTEYSTSVPLATWTGQADHNWLNGANWTPGVPGACSSVLIPSGLTQYPTLTAPAECALLTIESGASFIGAEFLTAGTTVVKQVLPVASYSYIASPVQSTTFSNVFNEHPNALWAYSYDEKTGDWLNQTAGTTLTPGTGYSIKTTIPQTARFEGQLNDGPVTKHLRKTNVSGNANREGWNLLGNPFSSAIEWDEVIKDGGVDDAVYVWNGTEYLSYVGGIGSLPGGIIPAMNGFMVHTALDNVTVTVPLNSRIHSNTPYYKGIYQNLLSLKAEANHITDESFVFFINEATAGFDSQYDAFKLMGVEEAPELYSLINGNQLSINSLPMEGNEIIEMGFKCGLDGTYKLTSSGMESFDATVPIWLEDLKTGTWQDLRLTQDYSFAYTTTDPEKRFRIHFSLGERSLKSEDISVYSKPNTIVVANKSAIPGTIEVFDLTGTHLLSTRLIASPSTEVPVHIPSGVYLVRVITENGNISNKVFMQ